MFESHLDTPVMRSAALTSLHPVDDSRLRELEDLGDRIAHLAAQIQSATYHLLVMIREFDDRGGWGGGGFLSCAHWLNWRAGVGIGTAREKVRVAHALGSLPLISEAMRQGKVSYSKVRAMTRVATPETEERLLEFALLGSASQVERLVRCWRRVDRIEEAKRDARRRESHELSTWTDENGMLVIYGRLEPEVGAVVTRALEAAQERLYQESTVEAAGWRAGGSVSRRSEESVLCRRADALGLVAEAALAAQFDPGTRGDRFLVTLHVEVPDDRDCGHDGMAFLEDGIGVSAETSRRLSCDSNMVTIVRTPRATYST
jgi:hypothetical protein